MIFPQAKILFHQIIYLINLFFSSFHPKATFRRDSFMVTWFKTIILFSLQLLISFLGIVSFSSIPQLKYYVIDLFITIIVCPHAHEQFHPHEDRDLDTYFFN